MFEKKISISAYSLAHAIAGAIGMAVLGLISLLGIGLPLVDILASLFVGFEASVPGVIVGIVYGFAVGGACGSVSGFFYNKMA